MKKRILFFGILLIGLFLSLGAGCSKENESTPTDTNKESPVKETIDNREVASSNILVDRTRYVIAGNPPFDFTHVIFTQKKDKQYKAVVSSDSELKGELMTDKDCLLKGEGKEYTAIETKEGKEIIFTSNEAASENINLCLGVTASGSGEIEVKFKVDEVSY